MMLVRAIEVISVDSAERGNGAVHNTIRTYNRAPPQNALVGGRYAFDGN